MYAPQPLQKTYIMLVHFNQAEGLYRRIMSAWGHQYAVCRANSATSSPGIKFIISSNKEFFECPACMSLLNALLLAFSVSRSQIFKCLLYYSLVSSWRSLDFSIVSWTQPRTFFYIIFSCNIQFRQRSTILDQKSWEFFPQQGK